MNASKPDGLLPESDGPRIALLAAHLYEACIPPIVFIVLQCIDTPHSRRITQNGGADLGLDP